MGTTVINFEELAVGTIVSTQYDTTHLRMVVDTPGIIDDGAGVAHSPTRFLRLAHTVSNPLPVLKLSFPRPVKRVKLFAGLVNSDSRYTFGTISGDGIYGANILIPPQQSVEVGKAATSFQIGAATNTISSVLLTISGINGSSSAAFGDLVIDDIEVEQEPLDGPSHLPLPPIIREYIYDQFALLKTLGGLVPVPRNPWTREVAAALNLGISADEVSEQVKATVLEATLKQLSLASASIKKEIKALSRGK